MVVLSVAAVAVVREGVYVSGARRLHGYLSGW